MSSHTPQQAPYYYVPAPSTYPITGSIALFLFALGSVLTMNKITGGGFVLGAGVLRRAGCRAGRRYDAESIADARAPKRDSSHRRGREGVDSCGEAKGGCFSGPNQTLAK